MVCPAQTREAAQVLVDYCAGTLEAAQASEFERHVSTCAECARIVEAQQSLWRTLDEWTPAPVSADFDQRLYARIASEQSAPAWRQWIQRALHPAIPFPMWKPAVSVAVACAVLAVGLAIRTPDAAVVNNDKQVRAERTVDIEQVETTLSDLDLLIPGN